MSPKGQENNEFAINRETLKHIVSSMKNNKTPGMDGLTAEFYKFFFDDIQDILVEVYTEINTKITVPKSMTKAVTTVIPKKSNCETPADYRPITLLNIDYKILTKYLNKVYFSEFLKSNISSEQLCAVPERNIHNGNIFIRDVITFCKNKNQAGILMSLDQKKAFDLVDRDFLFRVMKGFNFNTEVLKMVRTLYQNTTTSVQINGHLSEDIILQRGVRQGCPLSPSLYVIYVESFLLYIHSQAAFRGIPLTTNKVAKVTAYADDLLFFCQDNADVEYIFSFFDHIRQATGSELNRAKTQLLALGTAELTNEYAVDEIKVCGIIFKDTDGQEMERINMLECIRKLKSKINFFQTIPCTIKGKVIIVNTILYPIIFYMAHTFLPSAIHTALMKKLAFSLIYGEGKTELIKRRFIELAKEKGAMGLYELKSSCEATYLQDNLCLPVQESFEHQRLDLFLYFFSFWTRNLFPHTYTKNSAHCFKLLDQYKKAQTVLAKIDEKSKDILKISLVSTNQLYQFIIEEGDLLPIKIHTNRELNEIEKTRLIKMWNNYKVSSQNSSFMWKTATNGIVNGATLLKWKIQGVKTTCNFCIKPETETLEHVFASCSSLQVSRNIMIESVKKLGTHINTDKNDIPILFRLGLTPNDEGNTNNMNVFEYVAECNRKIWKIRHEIVFEKADHTDSRDLTGHADH